MVNVQPKLSLILRQESKRWFSQHKPPPWETETNTRLMQCNRLLSSVLERRSDVVLDRLILLVLINVDFPTVHSSSPSTNTGYNILFCGLIKLMYVWLK